jgi:hypothetical protein
MNSKTEAWSFGGIFSDFSADFFAKSALGYQGESLETGEIRPAVYWQAARCSPVYSTGESRRISGS